MTNPYQSSEISREATALPQWYILFYQLYWPAWWIGTALIAGSWFGIVSPTVGWLGFSLAGAAALGSNILPWFAGIKPPDYVVIDSRLLKSQGEDYLSAISRFRNGATLMYDGVAFGFRPNHEIGCGVVSNAANLDDSSANELADHAKSVYHQLVSESPEFAEAVDGKSFRISIMSSFDPKAQELCRIVDGKLTWKK
jgi:hypothetical protein